MQEEKGPYLPIPQRAPHHPPTAENRCAKELRDDTRHLT